MLFPGLSSFKCLMLWVKVSSLLCVLSPFSILFLPKERAFCTDAHSAGCRILITVSPFNVPHCSSRVGLSSLGKAIELNLQILLEKEESVLRTVVSLSWETMTVARRVLVSLASCGHSCSSNWATLSVRTLCLGCSSAQPHRAGAAKLQQVSPSSS